jgi:hypothetical protein
MTSARVPGALLHAVLLRRTGTVTNAALYTAPALQRTASQVLRAAQRPDSKPVHAAAVPRHRRRNVAMQRIGTFADAAD